MSKALITLGNAYYHIFPTLEEEIAKTGLEVEILKRDDIISPSEVAAHIADKVVYVVSIEQVTKEVIDAAPNLKLIIRLGAGVDTVDTAYAAEKGIQVANAPGMNADSVAELALGQMIAIARKIPQMHQSIQNGIWKISTGFEVSEKTVGIIGFGAIGQALAKRLSGFDTTIIAYGNYKDHAAAQKYQVSFVSFETLVEESDYVVICTAAKPSNYHLINASILKKLKKSSYIINVSRGSIINEVALIEALKHNEIAGAALDVFEEEPVTNELTTLENVVLTPHVGGTTEESIARISAQAVRNITLLLANEDVEYVVNRETLNKI